MSKILLIAGSCSSGTSAASEVMRACGLPTLTDLLAPSDTHPNGYLESQAVIDANSAILYAAGGTWYDPGTIAKVRPSAPAFSLMHEVVDSLPDGDLFLKEPRFSRTLPYWTQALQAAGRDVSVLITMRDPVDVAASLMVKHYFSINHGLRLWQRYIGELMAASDGLPRLVVPHDLPWKTLATAVRDELGFEGIKVRGAKPKLFTPKPLPTVSPADQGLVEACRALRSQALENAGLRP